MRRPLIPAGLEGQAHWIGAGRLARAGDLLGAAAREAGERRATAKVTAVMDRAARAGRAMDGQPRCSNSGIGLREKLPSGGQEAWQARQIAESGGDKQSTSNKYARERGEGSLLAASVAPCSLLGMPVRLATVLRGSSSLHVRTAYFLAKIMRKATGDPTQRSRWPPAAQIFLTVSDPHQRYFFQRRHLRQRWPCHRRHQRQYQQQRQEQAKKQEQVQQQQERQQQG